VVLLAGQKTSASPAVTRNAVAGGAGRLRAGSGFPASPLIRVARQEDCSTDVKDGAAASRARMLERYGVNEGMRGARWRSW